MTDPVARGFIEFDEMCRRPCVSETTRPSATMGKENLHGFTLFTYFTAGIVKGPVGPLLKNFRIA
jgi:hypothetical protein